METSRTVSSPSNLSQTPQEAPHELVESTQKRSKVELPQEKKDEEGEVNTSICDNPCMYNIFV